MQLFKAGLATQGINNQLNTGSQLYWLGGQATATLFPSQSISTSAGLTLGGSASTALGFSLTISAGLLLGGSTTRTLFFRRLCGDVAIGAMSGAATIQAMQGTAALSSMTGQGSAAAMSGAASVNAMSGNAEVSQCP